MSISPEVPTRLDSMARTRKTLRDEKRLLEAQIKEIDSKLRDNETDLLAAADEMGLDRFSVGNLSFSVSRNVVGNVQDWDAVWAYIIENSATHLIQRRLANAAYKELLDFDETLPGVEPFTKVSLNMRETPQA